jgi:predicted RNA-binding protein YlxR (DUF448 family)
MPGHETSRRCILSGHSASPDALVRLALSPAGEVCPDVGARAPGRGAWISADRAAIDAAERKGRLQGALARAFKGEVRVAPADLGGQIAAALSRQALDRLGLELRAGHLVTGSDRISDALVAGRVRLLLHAADAADDGVRKLEQRLHSAGGEAKSFVLPVARDEMSLALGQSNVVHAALCDRQAAARVAALVVRWRGFLGLEDGAVSGAGLAASA